MSSEPNLDYLMSKKLVFNHRMNVGEEDNGTEDHFLCAEIDDEDLPWDVKEIDW